MFYYSISEYYTDNFQKIIIGDEKYIKQLLTDEKIYFFNWIVECKDSVEEKVMAHFTKQLYDFEFYWKNPELDVGMAIILSGGKSISVNKYNLQQLNRVRNFSDEEFEEYFNTDQSKEECVAFLKIDYNIQEV